MNVKHYALVAGALLALLAATIGVAYLDLGRFNTPAAMAISVAKAAIIIIYFMHLRAAHGLVRIMALIGFFWLAIMFALAFSDFGSRGW